MAPEVFPGDDAAQFVNPMLCDIWALGIILFFCLTGNYPMPAALLPVHLEYRTIVSEPDGVQRVVAHYGFRNCRRMLQTSFNAC
jgi:serine/threonine protein kinase